MAMEGYHLEMEANDFLCNSFCKNEALTVVALIRTKFYKLTEHVS